MSCWCTQNECSQYDRCWKKPVQSTVSFLLQKTLDYVRWSLVTEKRISACLGLGQGQVGVGGGDHQGSWGNIRGGWVVHCLDCGDGDVRTCQLHTSNIHSSLPVNYNSIKLWKMVRGWEGARKEGRKKRRKEGRKEKKNWIQWCAGACRIRPSLSTSTVSDVTSVAGNRTWWEDIHYESGIRLTPATPSHRMYTGRTKPILEVP